MRITVPRAKPRAGRLQLPGCRSVQKARESTPPSGAGAPVAPGSWDAMMRMAAPRRKREPMMKRWMVRFSSSSTKLRSGSVPSYGVESSTSLCANTKVGA